MAIDQFFQNQEKKNGGGLAFYVREDFSANEYILEKDDRLENFSIELKNNENKGVLTFHLMYRPPGAKILEFWEMFEELIDKISEQNKDIIICGDFNIDISKENSQTKKYQGLINMYGLHVNNCEATRIPPSTMTCIDHSISNTFYDIATLRFNISDHYALVNFLNASNRPQNKRNFPRNWKRNFNFSRNYSSILKYLFLIHQFLSKIEANWSVDKKLAHITRSINQALDRFAPYQSFKNSKKILDNK